MVSKGLSLIQNNVHKLLKLEGFRIFTHFLRIFLEEKGIFVNKIRNFLWQDTIWLRAPKGLEGHIAGVDN